MSGFDREPHDEKPAPVRRRWCRRFGWAGFLFFLVKGLLWLAGPALVVAWRNLSS